MAVNGYRVHKGYTRYEPYIMIVSVHGIQCVIQQWQCEVGDWLTLPEMLSDEEKPHLLRLGTRFVLR